LAPCSSASSPPDRGAAPRRRPWESYQEGTLADLGLVERRHLLTGHGPG
jgi:hypothetical protein